MSALAYDKLLDQVETIARQAGAAILAIYGREFAVQEKADQSPLTEADNAANEIIVAGLRSLDPVFPVLSEEAVPDFMGVDAQQRYWLVDPLDGTREFVKRNGEFTVNIAFIEHGRPVLGVVYAPVPDIAYLAATGVGAYKVENGGARTSIRVACHVDGQPWQVVGSRTHAGDSLSSFLQLLGAHELVLMGSSLKLCLVAEGRADIYPRLGPTSLWDTAAAQCVVEQAGGAVIRMNGEPLSYGNPAHTLNPFFLVHGRGTQDWPTLTAEFVHK